MALKHHFGYTVVITVVVVTASPLAGKRKSIRAEGLAPHLRQERDSEYRTGRMSSTSDRKIDGVHHLSVHTSG